MKLAVIFPVLNQHELSRVAEDSAARNAAIKATSFLIVDNGSDEPIPPLCHPEDMYFHDVGVIRHDESIGVYPVFWDALKHTDADILAFFHSDLIITEKGWDERVLAEFERRPDLGLLGFIGSNEIDLAGGRGGGTTSNFQGGRYEERDGMGGQQTWVGSPAEVHGARSDGFSKAAVVDGCAMIFRRAVLEKIPQRPDFPPHHFYDRLLSCEVLERGYEVGVLGVACDHISGQTVNQEQKYADMAEEWARAHIPENLFAGNPPHYAWDATLYQEAERQWLGEYRDHKRLVPCRV